MSRGSKDDIEVLNKAGQEPSQEDLETLQSHIAQLTQKTAKKGQTLVLWYLLYGDRDCLFQAATGYGKSLIWKCAPMIEPGIALMLSPLNMLTEDQVSDLPAGARGLALTGENNKKKDIYDQIARGEYTHVCLSPEIACSRRFAEEVLEDSRFRQQNLYLIIDEVHIVDQWATFRKEYAKIGIFRARLPPSCRALGMSATLDEVTRKSVTQKGGFREPVFINTSIDRPEIFIEIRSAIQLNSTFEDLHFLFPDSIDWERSQTLPKTIIFFDSKSETRLALLSCRAWLRAAGLSEGQANKVVCCYYASMREDEKKRIRSEFRKPDSVYRIILATEAMGMGVELQAIQCVVQYGSKQILRDISSFKSLIQRMGRCARGRGEQGHFIWLVKPWFFTKPVQPYNVQPEFASNLQNSITFNTETGEVRISKAEATKWKNLDRVYQEMSRGCPRQTIFNFFTPKESRLRSQPLNLNPRCCSYCNPYQCFQSKASFSPQELQAALKLVENAALVVLKRNQLQLLTLPHDHKLKAVEKRTGLSREIIHTWRCRKVDEIYQQTRLRIEPCVIMPDRAVERLAEMNQLLTEPDGEAYIKHFVRSWPERGKYASEIRLIMIELYKKPIQYPSMTKARVKAVNNEELRSEFEERQSRRKERYGSRPPPSGLKGDRCEQFGWKLTNKERNKGPPTEIPNLLPAIPAGELALPAQIIELALPSRVMRRQELDENISSQYDSDTTQDTLQQGSVLDDAHDAYHSTELATQYRSDDEVDRLLPIEMVLRSSPPGERWSTLMDHRSPGGETARLLQPEPSLRASAPQREPRSRVIRNSVRSQRSSESRKRKQRTPSELSDSDDSVQSTISRSGRVIRPTQKLIEARRFRDI